jgi:hypothetical protein
MFSINHVSLLLLPFMDNPWLMLTIFNVKYLLYYLHETMESKCTFVIKVRTMYILPIDNWDNVDNGNIPSGKLT